MRLVKFAVVTTSFVLGPLVIAAVWVPVLLHFHVSTMNVSDDVMEKLRTMPDAELLADISSTVFLHEMNPKAGRDTVKTADKILSGVLDIADQDAIRITFPFDAHDLETPSGALQLALAGLVVPSVLLDAYQATADERYFDGAKAAIVAYAKYERLSLLPRGLQWNDHALAGDIQVLTEFWRIYRRHPSFDPDTARLVLSFADRCAGFLAKPSQYTFATNHGVMQNLALMHFALAFPKLPNTDRYARLGAARLESQMRFFLSGEGVVLEHSSGYHVGGTALLGTAIKYFELLGFEVPLDWRRKHEAAVSFSQLIRRPDGSLPQIGDTPGYVRDASGSGWQDRSHDTSQERTLTTFPVSGYAVLWASAPTGAKSQTVMTWSNFDGHAHKHADELSVDVWAAGREWWSNVGYWPYDSNLRAAAISWEGSSAPHRPGEPGVTLRAGEIGSTFRVSRLLASASKNGISAVDVVRKNHDGYSVRRQVVETGGDLWIVVDQHEGAARTGSRVVWSAAPDIIILPTTDRRCYLLHPTDKSAVMTSCFFGSAGTDVRLLRASTDPFAGWQLVGTRATPSSALVVDGSGDTPWLMSAWLLSEQGAEANAAPLELEAWDGPDRWTVAVHAGRSSRSVSRDGATITVRGADVASVTLEPSRDVAPEIAEIERAFAAAEREYPGFGAALGEYRLKVTNWLVGLWLLQEVVLAALARLRPSAVTPLRAVSIAGWLAVAAWLDFVYFVV